MKIIDPKKKYTLLEIHRDGLLISPKTGRPFKTKFSVRQRLHQLGFKPVYISEINQMAYKVRGAELIKFNKTINK